MILGLVQEAVDAGARRAKACEIVGVEPRTLQRWRAQGIGEDRRAGPRHPPANKLTPAERTRILQLVNLPEYRDLSPKQIVPRLADAGIYVGSESSLYRILREEDQMRHREPSRAPQKTYRPTEYVATGPNQVWSWDISYLRTSVRGLHYYLYVAMDVWSRKIVGWTIEEEESTELAQAMLAAALKREGIRRDQLVIHSDNGAPMKAATLLAFLQVLGIVPSFSRPSVSNDNPYSESLFRTAKYRPAYPRSGFQTIEAARQWMTWFVNWYNTEHRHSALKFVTPQQRHDGVDVAILARRAKVYEKARRRNPNRWTQGVRDWSPIEEVVLNPVPDAGHPATAVA